MIFCQIIVNYSIKNTYLLYVIKNNWNQLIVMSCTKQDGLKLDYINVFVQGKCLGKGTFDEMSTSEIDFSSLLKTNEEEEEKEKPPVVVYERATSVERAHSSLQNIGSTFSLTSIGTEFEVRSESSIISQSCFEEQYRNPSVNLSMNVSSKENI